MKKTKIYISGPMTNDDDYFSKFNHAQKVLEEVGYTVINPAKIAAFLPINLEHDEYLAVDFELLKLADEIYMLWGWEDSTGACEELGYAKALNYPIIYQTENPRNRRNLIHDND